ncbi:unnamed protein product, partial [marine sediment metagenome]
SFMPGSEKAIERPYRMAISYLYEVYKNKIYKNKKEGKKDIFNLVKKDFKNIFKGIGKVCSDTELKVIINQLITGFNSPLTSSCGRLFDAVSSLLSISQHNYYEGQAAIELEMVSDESVLESYPFMLRRESNNGFINEIIVIDTLPIIEGMIADIKKGYKSSYISAKFHNTIIDIITKICEMMHKKFNIKKVALSGGVFQNNIILNRTFKMLKEKGFAVFTNFQVPVNDGGISLGQAFIAHHIANTLKD